MVQATDATFIECVIRLCTIWVESLCDSTCVTADSREK